MATFGASYSVLGPNKSDKLEHIQEIPPRLSETVGVGSVQREAAGMGFVQPGELKPKGEPSATCHYAEGFLYRGLSQTLQRPIF